MNDNSPSRTKSLLFAKRIVHLYQYLCDEKKEYVLSNSCSAVGPASELIWQKPSMEAAERTF